MISRRAGVRRALCAALVVAVAGVAGAAPAAAVYRDDGDNPGPGFSLLETLGWFAGLPLLVIGVVAALIYGRSSARGPRYRPGLGWWSAPVWFNGPDEGRSGGATVMTGSPTAGGGASARW
jgi:hypothetical protein